MSGEYPGITINPEGLERLPEEARAPCEAILRKKRRGGHDIGRLFMFNTIAMHRGRHFIEEAESVRLLGELLTQSLPTYDKYQKAFHELEWARLVSDSIVANALPAAQALHMIAEAVEFANTDYPVCKWNRYGLDQQTWKTDDTSRRIKDLSESIRNAVRDSDICHAQFKLAGQCLKTPGIETMLEPFENELQKRISDYNLFAECLIEEFNKKNLSDEAEARVKIWLAPLPMREFEPDERLIAKARRNMDLNTFRDGFENAANLFKKAWRKHIGENE